MGGLTVLKALRDVLPREQFVYLGDTARLPYGTKSAATVGRYALQAAAHLVDTGVKALVVACNTASGLALPQLVARHSDLPVIGVVQPGAVAAAKAAGDGGVYVLATESTIRGGAYQRALTSLSPRIRVFGRSCPLWVTLAEMGPQPEALVDSVIGHRLHGIDQSNVSAILLGCTHFPVFRDVVGSMLASDIRIIDSAETTAEAVGDALFAADLLADHAQPGVIYRATDSVERFKRVGPYFLGEEITEVELVDL
jgi:glutamate racemase